MKNPRYRPGGTGPPSYRLEEQFDSEDSPVMVAELALRGDFISMDLFRGGVLTALILENVIFNVAKPNVGAINSTYAFVIFYFNVREDIFQFFVASSRYYPTSE
ncbi:unnamed protein product [Tuber aestivum]|uniref:Uncharacterized protein n=1 Tax=Tuber aestivum TaxID=59557 RepID=A0A292Q8V5_9PEZI|nr:unnamed protein product [Tuber aestivum]